MPWVWVFGVGGCSFCGSGCLQESSAFDDIVMLPQTLENISIAVAFVGRSTASPAGLYDNVYKSRKDAPIDDACWGEKDAP